MTGMFQGFSLKPSLDAGAFPPLLNLAVAKRGWCILTSFAVCRFHPALQVASSHPLLGLLGQDLVASRNAHVERIQSELGPKASKVGLGMHANV
jgi:hypothetical protein